MAKTNVKEIERELKRLGYVVDSYAPGNKRLYAVGVRRNGGIKKLTPRMVASELKTFYYGLMVANGYDMSTWG